MGDLLVKRRIGLGPQHLALVPQLKVIFARGGWCAQATLQHSLKKDKENRNCRALCGRRSITGCVFANFRIAMLRCVRKEIGRSPRALNGQVVHGGQRTVGIALVRKREFRTGGSNDDQALTKSFGAILPWLRVFQAFSWQMCRIECCRRPSCDRVCMYYETYHENTAVQPEFQKATATIVFVMMLLVLCGSTTL